MSRKTVLSTAIDEKVKQAAADYCKARGIKLQYFIEQALIEHLEDILDVEAYQQRKEEETIPLEEMLESIKKR